MLGDQGSPYVGRFARGWHRLPGLIPGQPQTRTGAPPEYRHRLTGGASRVVPEGGPSRNESEKDRQAVTTWISRGRRPREHCGAGGSCRAGGEDVVHQEDPRGRRTAGGGANAPSIARNRSSRVRRDCGVVAVVRRTKATAGKVELAGERTREHARLVEPALGPPPASERYPRHGVGRRRAERRHGGRERLPHPAPSRELQAVDRVAGRSPVRERGTGRRDRCWRTVATAYRPPWATAGRSAGTTAAAGERARPRHRRRTATAPHRTRHRPAGRGCRPPDRAPSLARRHATARRRHAQGSGTSIGSASLTEIVTTRLGLQHGVGDDGPDLRPAVERRLQHRQPSAVRCQGERGLRPSVPELHRIALAPELVEPDRARPGLDRLPDGDLVPSASRPAATGRRSAHRDARSPARRRSPPRIRSRTSRARARRPGTRTARRGPGSAPPRASPRACPSTPDRAPASSTARASSSRT